MNIKSAGIPVALAFLAARGCALDEKPLQGLGPDASTCSPCEPDAGGLRDAEARRDAAGDAPEPTFELVVDPVPQRTHRPRWVVTGTAAAPDGRAALLSGEVEVGDGTVTPEGTFRLVSELRVGEPQQWTVRVTSQDALTTMETAVAWDGTPLAIVRDQLMQLLSLDDRDPLSAGAAIPGFSCSLADMDGDQDLDLFITTGSRVFENDGSGLFSDVTSDLAPSGIMSSDGAVWFDYDLDGDLDLATTTQYGGLVWMYEAEGPGGPLNEVGDLVGLRPIAAASGASMAVTDIDPAGTADLVVMLHDLLGAYLSNAGSFSPVFDDSLGLNPVGDGSVDRLATGDVDLDGRRELAVAAPSPRSYFQATESGWSPSPLDPEYLMAGSPQVGYESTAFGDVDDDGDLDLVAVVPGQSFLYANEGGTLSPSVALPAVADGAKDLAVADVDGDGGSEIIIATDREIQILTRGEGGEFSAVDSTWGVAGTVADEIMAIAPADADSDGDLDLLAIQRNGGHFVLRNQLDLPTSTLRFRVSGPGAGTGGTVILREPGGRAVGARSLAAAHGRGVQEPDEAVFGGIAASWRYHFDVVLPGETLSGDVTPMTDGALVVVAR